MTSFQQSHTFTLGVGIVKEREFPMFRMVDFSKFLGLVGASILWISDANLLFAETSSKVRCTASTARQIESPAELCACDIVTKRMIRYVQRRSDFADILSETSEMCPQVAAVLSDLPTATIDDSSGYQMGGFGDASDTGDNGGGGNGNSGNTNGGSGGSNGNGGNTSGGNQGNGGGDNGGGGNGNSGNTNGGSGGSNGNGGNTSGGNQGNGGGDNGGGGNGNSGNTNGGSGGSNGNGGNTSGGNQGNGGGDNGTK
ncbi:hypothetical protein [Shimia gijangensis]|nr:hypothetical protein [Shimia gijangensis]